MPVNWSENPKYPMPILTVVGSDQEQGIDWYIDSVNQFLNAFCSQKNYFMINREKPLVALPLVGIGKGGAADKIAELIKNLLVFCHQQAQARHIDIVLTVIDPFHYTVCQMERKKLNETTDFWPELNPTQLEAGQRIANHAKKGELVLFLGAGVSAGAGLPSWGTIT